MGGRHEPPRTGDGKTSSAKPQKTQITQQTKNGTNLPKQTAKLWGIFSDRK